MLSQSNHIKFLRIQSLARKTSDLYQLVCNKGVDTAISWFEEKWSKKSMGRIICILLASELLRSGKLEEAIRLYEYDILQTPNRKCGFTVNLQNYCTYRSGSWKKLRYYSRSSISNQARGRTIDRPSKRDSPQFFSATSPRNITVVCGMLCSTFIASHIQTQRWS